jgi:protease-4
VININSPGGSPVQADYIYSNIVRLKKKYPNKKLYAVCNDICASAAYYVATAADEIYANPSSIVGSIGVLINGFGFVDTLNKLGIERRLLTAGSEKGFLDPFSPAKPQDNAYAQKMLTIVHQHFIKAVQDGRGTRLKNDPNIFSGLAWTGDQAKDLGLIDGFGSPGFVAREIIRNANIIDYTKKPGLLGSFTKDLSASFAHEIGAQFGLGDGNRPFR